MSLDKSHIEPPFYTYGSSEDAGIAGSSKTCSKIIPYDFFKFGQSFGHFPINLKNHQTLASLFT